MLKYTLLERAERREKGAAKIALLLGFLRLQFFRAIMPCMQKRQCHQEDAGISEAPGGHSKVVLPHSEEVAADQLGANLAADSGENQRDQHCEQGVNRHIT